MKVVRVFVGEVVVWVTCRTLPVLVLLWDNRTWWL